MKRAAGRCPVFVSSFARLPLSLSLSLSLLVFDLTTAAVIYCVLVGVVFLGLWLWYDRRDHQRFERERRRTTFHCIRCSAVYTGPTHTELLRCPRCGHENSRLRF